MKSSVVLLLLLSGCAFKGPDDGAAAAASPSPVPPAAFARVSWWSTPTEKSALLTRELQAGGPAGTMRAGEPVTLPTAVPSALEVELDLPGGLTAISTGTVLVQGVRDSVAQALPTEKAALVHSDADSSVIVLQIGKIDSLIADGQEAELRIVINSADGTFATVCLPIRTPPSLVQIRALSVKDAESAGVHFEPEVKSLQSGSALWGLIAVIQVANMDGRGIALVFPISVAGSLTLHRTHYRAQSAPPCGSSVGADSSNDSISDQLVALPIAAPLKTLLGLERKALSASEIVVVGGEAQSVGIYAAGVAATTIALGQYQKLTAQKASVIDHCESKCDHMRSGDDEFPACWATYLRQRGAAATPTAQIARCLVCARGDQQACEDCRRWEETARMFDGFGPSGRLSGGPNCLFCGTIVSQGPIPIQAGQLGWRDEAVMADRPVGIQDGDLALEAADTLAAAVRYSDSRDDPAARSIPLLKGSLGISF